MRILDANIFLYAYNRSAPQQIEASTWITKLLDSGEAVGLPWLTIWAFVRISTNSRLYPNPLNAQQAFQIIRDLMAQPNVIVLHPGPRHLELLERLVHEYTASGPLVTDAALAALAIENGAVLASTDQDFRRFSELRWLHPLKG
jgi:toxin-antitoxin system PIN domain toxin